MAAFDFGGEQDGDLPFVTGDVIIVTSQDGDWWTGKLGSKEGIFPGNYVTKKQDSVQPTQVRKYFCCIFCSNKTLANLEYLCNCS